MDISSYVTVLPIVIICYLVGIGCKASKKISDKTIPVIVGIVGGIVAVPASRQRILLRQSQLELCLDLRLRGSIRCINRAKKRSKNRQKNQF